MRKFVLVAIAALSLGIGSAYAASGQYQNSHSRTSYPAFNVGGDGAAG